jgi:hypothetical protein
MSLGRRLAWLVEAVDAWIAAKAAQVTAQAEEYRVFMQAPPKRRGRPTKAEVNAKHFQAEKAWRREDDTHS